MAHENSQQDESNLADNAPAVSGATTDIVEYQPHEQAIKDIEERFKDVVYDVTTTKGLDEATKARAEIRQVRYALKHTSKNVLVPYQQLVKDAQARVNQVKDFGESLTARVFAIENPIDDAIKAEEQRKADAKAQREAEERLRIEEIKAKITRFREGPAKFAASTAAEILDILERTKLSVILPDDYAEFEGEATIARDNAIEQLETLHKAALQREQAEEELRQQREQFERQQQELEELRKKQLEDEQRRQEEERQRLADQKAELDRQRQKLEEQQAEQRRQQEEQQRQQQEQDRRAEEERQRLADQRAAQDRREEESRQRMAEQQEELERLRNQSSQPSPSFAASTSVASPAPVAVASAPVTAHEEEPADIENDAPSAKAIIEVVAMGFDVTEAKAVEWLRSIQF